MNHDSHRCHFLANKQKDRQILKSLNFPSATPRILNSCPPSPLLCILRETYCYTSLHVASQHANAFGSRQTCISTTRRDRARTENIMYFSYSPSPPSTSYSTSPMEIPSSSSSRPQSPSCAFPSWPRRASLSSNSSHGDEASSSFIISDEELFPLVFDDADRDCTPPATPYSSRSPASPSRMCDIVVDNGSLMRELMAQEKTKKERRRRKSTSSKKSRSGSKTHMSPILEVVE
jgi:hypothetical protein